jgi:hypothetical protein
MEKFLLGFYSKWLCSQGLGILWFLQTRVFPVLYLSNIGASRTVVLGQICNTPNPLNNLLRDGASKFQFP